jgi:hypothetical protein
VGARSDIQDILDGAAAILLPEMSTAEFTARQWAAMTRLPAFIEPVVRETL